jgi:hypothetical protein
MPVGEDRGSGGDSVQAAGLLTLVPFGPDEVLGLHSMERGVEIGLVQLRAMTTVGSPEPAPDLVAGTILLPHRPDDRPDNSIVQRPVLLRARYDPLGGD